MVEVWEKIEFKVGKHTLVYNVHPQFLMNTTTGFGHTNAEIFQLLGIEDPVAFADKVYGYPSSQPNKDSFPVYHVNDLEAATKIIEALKEKCEKVTDHLVKNGESIYFRIGDCTLTYRVHPTHLCNSGGSNNEIFEKLGLEKYTICTQCYGYPAAYGSFPACAYGDYVALTVVVDYLQQKCKEYNEKTLLPEDFQTKPGKISLTYVKNELPWDETPAYKAEPLPPTSSMLSETTLLTSRKSNTCKF